MYSLDIGRFIEVIFADDIDSAWQKFAPDNAAWICKQLKTEDTLDEVLQDFADWPPLLLDIEAEVWLSSITHERSDDLIDVVAIKVNE